jgi:hypothetical protein
MRLTSGVAMHKGGTAPPNFERFTDISFIEFKRENLGRAMVGTPNKLASRRMRGQAWFAHTKVSS